MKMSVRFWKYHALGNDYIVVRSEDAGEMLAPPAVRRLCDRHRGVGADGVLVWTHDPAASGFRLRILNPDGSEAEKSGNGLRILARHLWNQRLVSRHPFAVATAGGVVECQVEDQGGAISVEMGRVSFRSEDVPVVGPSRDVLDEPMVIAGRALRFSAVSIGNPHCVVRCATISATEARILGPLIERDARFPQRTNVQFVRVRDRWNIEIEIWERGAGYTLSSGSSSCAAAAVAHRLGWCDDAVRVHMPGGVLSIEIAGTGHVRMRGPAEAIFEGVLSWQWTVPDA